MKKRFKKITDNFDLILIALPCIIVMFIVKYLPLPGLYMAFVKFRPGPNYFINLFTSEFVGFKNFEFMFFTKDIFSILRNTIGYNIIFIIINLVASVSTAIMINEITFNKTKKTLHTLMFLPYFMSWIAVSFMMYGFLSDKGLINTIIQNFGGQPISFYTSPKYWPFILVFMNVWKGVGYGSVIYLSALAGIDRSMYEAAIIDGASKWQQIKFITLPSLKPMIIILTILAIGGIMYSDFGLFYQVPKDNPQLYEVTQTLDIYVFNSLKILNRPALSAAAGLFQSTVGFFLILIVNFIVRKIDATKALF
ncbi:MAG: ABC transporter permease [Bacilli bacterium]